MLEIAVLEAGWSLTDGSSSSNIITFMLLRYIVSYLFQYKYNIESIILLFAFKIILLLFVLLSKLL